MSTVINRHRFAKTIVCVNDPYTHLQSIKDEEKELRRKGIGQVPNVFMKKEDIFPNAKDLKVIMTGNENKTRIQRLIRLEFINVARNKKILWSVGPVKISTAEKK